MIPPPSYFPLYPSYPYRYPYREDAGEQRGNANETFGNLTPLSQAPAELVRADWAAVIPNTTVPLIWEIAT